MSKFHCLDDSVKLSSRQETSLRLVNRNPLPFNVPLVHMSALRYKLPLRDYNMEASLDIAIISASKAFLSAPIGFLVANTCICTLHASHVDKPTILTGLARK